MTTPVTMPLSFSLLLAEMVNTLMFKEVRDEKGNKSLVERDIPFALKFRLTKNKAVLDKDVMEFSQQQMILLAKYGESTENDESVVIKDEEKFNLYKEEMNAILDTMVTHNVDKLDPAKFDEILDASDIHFSENALKVLLNYLVDDEEFKADMDMKINFKPFTPAVEEKKEEVVEEVKALVVEEVKVEAPKAEEVKVAAKKAPAKKTTTKAAAKPAAKKTSTTKKTTKKKEA